MNDGIPLCYWNRVTGETWEEDWSRSAYARWGIGIAYYYWKRLDVPLEFM